MNQLRQAAEMALEALRNAEVVYMEQLNAMYALQEALAESKHEWVGLTNQDRNDLEDYCEMIIGKAAFDAIEIKLKEKNE